MTEQKWKQFLTEIHLRWPLLDVEHSAATEPSQIIELLCRVTGCSKSRGEREIKELMRHFEERLERAA